MNNCIAIITARGGSKRIPRKNIKPFLGKPILQYSIEAALKAGCFDEVMVSTDDTEIAEIAENSGAKVPFFRSRKTSDDFSATADVLYEVLEDYQKLGKDFKYCCCIYPTAPFVTAYKLNNAFQLLKNKKAHSVVPVVRFGFPILRSLKIENGVVKMNWPEYRNTRSQDLSPAYHDCGQFYFMETAAFMKDKKIFTDFTLPMEMPETEVQDIDNEQDWLMAELKYKLIHPETQKD